MVPLASIVVMVQLLEGATNTTPWGKVDKKGAQFPVTNEAHLDYYKANGRYKVEERTVKTRAERATASGKDTVGQPARSGPGKGMPISDQRLLALARTSVKINDAKARLVALAQDLGVEGIDFRNPPTNAQLLKAVQERQAAIIADHAAGEGGSDGEQDPPATS